MNKKTLLTQALTAAMTVSTGMNFCEPSHAAYDNNPDRSRGARGFKRKRTRRKIAARSRRANRRK